LNPISFPMAKEPDFRLVQFAVHIPKIEYVCCLLVL
jgi:hypothetical protein